MASVIKSLDVRSILLSEWDPAGIGSMPDLADEYDSYIPKIMSLIAGAQPNLLATYLESIEMDMGVNPDPEKLNRTLSALCKLAG